METDHCLVLVDLREKLADSRNRTARQFRYEDVWQTHNEYDQLILDEWQGGARQNGLAGVVHPLNNMQSKLAILGAKESECLSRKVRKLRDKLDRLRDQSVGCGPADEERVVVK